MILLTPVRAKLKEDIIFREKVLKKTTKGKYPLGFEIKLIGGVKGDINYPEIISENLKPYSKNPNFYLTLHQPIERKDFASVGTDLTTKAGLQVLEKVLRLAKEINAKLVNLHTEKIYLGRDLIRRKFSFKEKRLFQKKVSEGVIRTKEKVNYQGKIAFENMPYALMGDDPRFKTVEEMVFDPLIITVEDLFFFAKLKKKIGVCLDTAHYGITQRTINDSLRNKTEQRDLVALPKEDVKIQPTLIKLAEKLGDNLFQVHFSDFENIWIPNKVYSLERVVPGEGDFGEELRQFLKYLTKKDIPVMLEIIDKNYKVLNETQKTIKWLINNI